MQIYVAGIHTNIGKTCVSVAICSAFLYDYFKLIQAGNPQDKDFVAKYADSKINIFDNGITLQTPASPHIASIKENKMYNAFDIKIPDSKNLVIEIAGGLFSPIDLNYCMIDYMVKNPLPCVLVGGYYLGSINHILLSIEALKIRNIKLLAIIISMQKNENKINQIDDFIKHYSDVSLVHLEHFDKTNFFQKTQKFKQEIESIFLL